MANMIALGNMFGAGNMEITELPIRDLCPRKNHRFHESSKAKRDAIAESIMEFGVIEPVIVRPKKDCAYPIGGDYEILAGHQRTELSLAVGKKTVPCIIKEGLTEEEAEQYVTETNLQRSFEEMSYSERAAVLAGHYNTMKKRNVRKEVLDEINTYLQTYANPVNTRADDGLSHSGTEGIRGVAEEHDLSKSTIARYIRIDTLIEDLKVMLDDNEIALLPAVELSYISADNQSSFVELMRENEYKCDIKKAKLIRECQQKGKLTVATMQEILSGEKAKKAPGKPKAFSLSGSIVKKYTDEGYFKADQSKKEIEEIIDKALEMYFAQNE